MFNLIINFIISIIDFLFQLVIAPILTFISTGIPNFDYGVNVLTNVLDLIFSHLAWLISFTGLSDFSIDLIFGFLIFKISVMLFEKPIKLFIKYWKLK